MCGETHLDKSTSISGLGDVNGDLRSSTSYDDFKNQSAPVVLSLVVLDNESQSLRVGDLQNRKAWHRDRYLPYVLTFFASFHPLSPSSTSVIIPGKSIGFTCLRSPPAIMRAATSARADPSAARSAVSLYKLIGSEFFLVVQY